MTTSDSVRPLTAAGQAYARECMHAHPARIRAIEDEARAGSLDAAIAAVEALPGVVGAVNESREWPDWVERSAVLAALREAKP